MVTLNAGGATNLLRREGSPPTTEAAMLRTITEAPSVVNGLESSCHSSNVRQTSQALEKTRFFRSPTAIDPATLEKMN